MHVTIEAKVNIEPETIAIECLPDYESALDFIKGIERQVGDVDFLKMIYRWAKEEMKDEGLLGEENGNDLSAVGKS